MDHLTPALILAGTIITASITYFIAKRNTSGNISTSDAASLWAESNALRQEYKDRAEKLEARLEEVNRQLQGVMTQLTELKGKGDKMIQKIDELKRIITKLRAENQRLLAFKKGVTDGSR